MATHTVLTAYPNILLTYTQPWKSNFLDIKHIQYYHKQEDAENSSDGADGIEDKTLKRFRISKTNKYLNIDCQLACATNLNLKQLLAFVCVCVCVCVYWGD